MSRRRPALWRCWGGSIIANAWRSASNRATTSRVSIPSLITLSATRRRTGFSCSAMKTTPKPPSPDFFEQLVATNQAAGPFTDKRG